MSSYEPGSPPASEACGDPRAYGPPCGVFGWGRVREWTIRQRGAPAEPRGLASAALRLLAAHLLLSSGQSPGQTPARALGARGRAHDPSVSLGFVFFLKTVYNGAGFGSEEGSEGREGATPPRCLGGPPRRGRSTRGPRWRGLHVGQLVALGPYPWRPAARSVPQGTSLISETG